MSSFLAHAGDLTILLVIAGVLVVVALLVAEIAHRFVFGPRRAEVMAYFWRCVFRGGYQAGARHAAVGSALEVVDQAQRRRSAGGTANACLGE